MNSNIKTPFTNYTIFGGSPADVAMIRDMAAEESSDCRAGPVFSRAAFESRIKKQWPNADLKYTEQYQINTGIVPGRVDVVLAP